MKVTWYNQT